MKKTVIKVCALLLCLAMLIPLSGCSSIHKILLLTMDNNEKGEYIVGKADKKMDRMRSYQEDTVGEVSGKLDDVDFKVTTREKGVFVNIGRKNYACLITGENVFDIGNGESSSVETYTKGYQNGKMFRTNRRDGASCNLWSSISADDYQEHIESMNDDYDFDESDAEKCVYTENEDGSMTVIFTDFNEEAIEELSTEIVNGTLSVVAPGCTIKNIEFEATVTKDFYYEYATLRLYLINKTSAKTEVSEYAITSTYSDINKVSSPDPINFSDYTEVDDLRCLDRYSKYMTDFICLNEGKFKSSMSYKISAAGSVDTNSETNIISFTRYNGKVNYTIETRIDGNRYIIEYANGYQKVYILYQGEKERVSTTELSLSEAEIYLRGLLDPAGYSESNVIGVTVNDTGYEIAIDPETDDTVKTLIEMYGGTFETGTKTLIVEYAEDGEGFDLVRCRVNVTLLINGEEMVIERSSTCTFN